MTLIKIDNTSDGQRNENQPEIESVNTWKEVLKIDVAKEDEKEKADEVLVAHVTNPEVKEE